MGWVTEQNTEHTDFWHSEATYENMKKKLYIYTTELHIKATAEYHLLQAVKSKSEIA